MSYAYQMQWKPTASIARHVAIRNNFIWIVLENRNRRFVIYVEAMAYDLFVGIISAVLANRPSLDPVDHIFLVGASEVDDAKYFQIGLYKFDLVQIAWDAIEDQ